MEKYIIKITSDDKIELVPYEGYNTINKCVGGWYERCGRIPSNEVSEGYDYSIWCNEEFLYVDDCKFNAIATILANQQIYGNVAILLEAYNEEHELDACPLCIKAAQKFKSMLEEFAEHFDLIIHKLHLEFDNAQKPKPNIQFYTDKGD